MPTSSRMDGGRHEGNGEIHFGWVLEGRAVQHVWMIPRRRDRRSDAAPLPAAGNRYGTAVRVYDRAIDAWCILWIDPAPNVFVQQIGRVRGWDIVPEGTTDSGSLTRWSFTNITSRSFHWLGENSSDDSWSWRLLVEVLAKRAS